MQLEFSLLGALYPRKTFRGQALACCPGRYWFNVQLVQSFSSLRLASLFALCEDLRSQTWAERTEVSLRTESLQPHSFSPSFLHLHPSSFISVPRRIWDRPRSRWGHYPCPVSYRRVDFLADSQRFSTIASAISAGTGSSVSRPNSSIAR